MSLIHEYKENQQEINTIQNLIDHFKLESRFNVRWKKTWRKDYISPGVYAGQFELDFTNKQMKKFIAEDLIMKATYTDPQSGVRRAAILFKARLLPQRTRLKKLMCGELFSELQKSLFIVGILFLAVAILWARRSVSSTGAAVAITQAPHPNASPLPVLASPSRKPTVPHSASPNRRRVYPQRRRLPKSLHGHHPSSWSMND
jgi:hypothetical protein